MAVHERVWERGEGPQGRRHAPAETPWRPVMTWSLLGAMAGVFALQMILRPSSPGLEGWLFLVGTDWPARVWSPLTSTFAHADVAHLLFNGLFLFFLGPSVESILGRRRMLVLFLVAGSVSGLLQVHISAWLDGTDLALALGASGALNAIFGILIVLTPNDKLLVWGIIPVPMWLAGILFAAVDALGVFDPTSSVGNIAHLAGLAIGLAYALQVRADFRRRGIRLTRG